MAEQPGPGQVSENPGCWIGAIIIAALLALGLCSKQSNETAGGPTMNSVELAAGPDAQQPPPAPQPLSSSATKLGFRHFRLAYRLEGAAGAMIYSRNCYDALDRHFSWAKLDICGAFDVAAARAIADDSSASAEESTYFDEEGAAGRYLGAATKGGEQASEADERLVLLQRRAPKPPRPTAVSADQNLSNAAAAEDPLDDLAAANDD